jgi:hypothetical protein
MVLFICKTFEIISGDAEINAAMKLSGSKI